MILFRSHCQRLGLRRQLHAGARVDYQEKYAQKLQQRASETGLSVGELRAKVLEEAKAKAKTETKARPGLAKEPLNPVRNTVKTARKDSSPVRPLSSVLNLSRIFDTPHTTEQVSAIWTAYHTARAGGGYVCATVPLAAYERMTGVAMRYPYFVVPVPRTSEDASTENGTACEFYIMQWAFYDIPPVPSTLDNDQTSQEVHDSCNPRTSTVLFAPLHEYKQRDTFTTPHLVLTHYTDLARTHGVVLLRGEITPSNAADTAQPRYLMSQQDAQMLAMGVQRFYLWGQGRNEERLLKAFHENSEQFDWKELLKYANLNMPL